MVKKRHCYICGRLLTSIEIDICSNCVHKDILIAGEDLKSSGRVTNPDKKQRRVYDKKE